MHRSVNIWQSCPCWDQEYGSARKEIDNWTDSQEEEKTNWEKKLERMKPCLSGEKRKEDIRLPV